VAPPRIRRVAATSAEIHDWLEAFSSAVRSVDYARGARLFDPVALGFGSVAERADGCEQLVREQWRKTWPVTRDFRFDLDLARIEVVGDVAWVASTWSSTGLDAAGVPFPRVGRSSIVLRRSAKGWLAVHTHFSLRPATAGPG